MGNIKEFLEEENILDYYEYFKEKKKKEYQHNYYLNKTKPKRHAPTHT